MGDFNSKSAEWEETHLDRKRILISEMVARNDLTVLNTGREMKLDLTIAAPRLASSINDWCVLKVTSSNDHQCIEFSILERSHPVKTGRSGKRRNPSLNTRQLSIDKF